MFETSLLKEIPSLPMQQNFLFPSNWFVDIQRFYFTEKNPLRLEELAPDSPKKVWWRCRAGSDHIWLEPVATRYQEKELGCPFCRGEKLSDTNNLARLYPHLAKEFLSQFNEGLIPNICLPNSPKRVWWKCDKGEDHLWQESIKNRVQQDKGCPFCANAKVSNTNSLKTLFPKIAKQWHLEKNAPLSPEHILPESSKRVWWKCDKGADHEWEESIKNRAYEETNCPFCAGEEVSQTNCLATLFPKIAAEWDLEKNEGLLPTQLLPESKKKIWWKCPKGDEHRWLAPVIERIEQKNKCPFCSGKFPSKLTSLAGKFPEISAQWHPEKNGDLFPDHFFPEVQKKVWWKCDQGVDHEWEASIKTRTSKKEGCPFCAGEQLSITNCFATKYPLLAQQWHPQKNNQSPTQFFPNETTTFWWKCPEGRDHEWEASIAQRVENNVCPFCAGERLSEKNSFQARYPEIAREWHSRYNRKIKPSQFLPDADVLVWWECAKNPDHVWMDSILKRVQGASCFDCRILNEMKQKKRGNFS